MIEDGEVLALGEIVARIDRFDFETQVRMLRFLCQRYKDQYSAWLITQAKPGADRGTT